MLMISSTSCDSKNRQGHENLAQLKSCFARLQARFRRNGVTLHSAWERASDTSNKFAAACIGKFDGCESTLCNLWNEPAAYHAADAFLPSFFPTIRASFVHNAFSGWAAEMQRAVGWGAASSGAVRVMLCAGSTTATRVAFAPCRSMTHPPAEAVSNACGEKKGGADGFAAFRNAKRTNARTCTTQNLRYALMASRFLACLSYRRPTKCSWSQPRFALCSLS